MIVRVNQQVTLVLELLNASSVHILYTPSKAFTQYTSGIGNLATISASGTNGAQVTGSSPQLAVCDLNNATNNNAASPNGRLYFSTAPSGIKIVGSFNGIGGVHGIHIHTVRFTHVISRK